MDTYNRHSFGQSGQTPANFDSVVQVGTQAPDFTLTDLDGQKVSLSDYRGRKHVVLEFGNITWPPFVGEVPSLTQFSRKYREHDFEFLIVYVRESHPGENFPHHRFVEQKVAHARKLKELEGVDLRILVDDLQGAVHRQYGLLSNMVYLIDREGTVLYKSDWTDAAELDEMCASLLRLEEMKKQGVPIIRKGISERLHWIPMDPILRERVYRRSGEKAIQDYFKVFGFLPYATDAEKKSPPWMLQRYTVPGQYIESAPNGYLNQASQAVEGCKVSWQNTAAESREAEEISAICALFRFRLVSDLLIDVTLIKAMLDGPENARVSRFSFCRDAQRSWAAQAKVG